MQGKKRGFELSKQKDYEQRTEALVLPILEHYRYELVDVEFVKEAGSWHLRVYVDKEGGITIDALLRNQKIISGTWEKMWN